MRACSSSRQDTSPQDMQTTRCVVPWSSSTLLLPALWCRRSTFWVMQSCAQPARCRAAMPRWAALGATLLNFGQPAKERAQ